MPIRANHAAFAAILAGLMLATRCLAWRDIGKALSVPVVMIIVTSLALGHALTQTGAAELVARPGLAWPALLVAIPGDHGATLSLRVRRGKPEDDKATLGSATIRSAGRRWGSGACGPLLAGRRPTGRCGWQ